jgi:PAS domain S-box-containing protein
MRVSQKPATSGERQLYSIRITENDLFRKLIENSHEGISLLNEDFEVIFRSPSAERISGWIDTKLSFLATQELIHPDDWPAVIVTLEKVKQKAGAVQSLSFRSRHRDGNYIWLECTYTNALHQPGIEAIVCNFRDISERKRSEEVYQQTMLELLAYKYALDESAIVAITDQRGVIKHVNDNFCRISKYSVDELIGQDHRIINSSFHEKNFIRELWRTIASGTIWRGELKNKAKDGTHYWVDTTIVPFLDEKGKPYQYVAIRSDITERKQSEMQLRTLNDNLQKHTKELAMSNDELEQFAYVASHDLQEPLRMVTSFLSLLENKYNATLDDKGRQYIHFAVDGAKRMRQIILDLLEFSRVGRKEEKTEEVDMNQLLAETLNLLSKQIEEQKAQITHQQLPVLTTFKAPLRQVLQNLIGNALKYQHTGTKPIVKIGCEDIGHHWQISVQDNGIGIDQEYYDKIFIIFQRLHSKDEYSGTGMGLAVTKKIIENLGGKIWVESTRGEGSAFYFTLLKNKQ